MATQRCIPKGFVQTGSPDVGTRSHDHRACSDQLAHDARARGSLYIKLFVFAFQLSLLTHFCHKIRLFLVNIFKDIKMLLSKSSVKEIPRDV